MYAAPLSVNKDVNKRSISIHIDVTPFLSPPVFTCLSATNSPPTTRHVLLEMFMVCPVSFSLEWRRNYFEDVIEKSTQHLSRHLLSAWLPWTVSHLPWCAASVVINCPPSCQRSYILWLPSVLSVVPVMLAAQERVNVCARLLVLTEWGKCVQLYTCGLAMKTWWH